MCCQHKITEYEGTLKLELEKRIESKYWYKNEKNVSKNSRDCLPGTLGGCLPVSVHGYM